MNQRAVSAPYSSMIASGSMTFFFDFDILMTGPIVTGAPVSTRLARSPSTRTRPGSCQVLRPSASSV